jgi:O-antigen/teichoic acid export membrane protein
MTANTISPTEARRAARNAITLIFASFISKGILYGWQIILGNWLGPEDYGIYSTVLSLMAVSSAVVSFGMGIIIIREVARHPERIGQYWAAALFMQTVLALGAYLAALVSGVLAGYSDTIIAFTAIGALSLFIDMFGSQANDLLIAQERMAIASTIDIAHILLRVGLAWLALQAGWGLLGVYVVTIGMGLVRTTLIIGANLRLGVRPTLPLNRAIARQLFWDAAPLALAAFLNLLYQHIDKLMTTAVIGEAATGYMTPAFTINFGVIELMNTTVLVALFPLMSRYYGDGTQPIFGSITEKLARFTFLICLPITLSLSIFAPNVIALLYRSAFAPTAGILRILIWYTLITMVANVIVYAMQVQNKQRQVLGMRAGGVVVNITLNAILLLSLRDPRGAALASVAAESFMLTLLFVYFQALGWERALVLRGMVRVALIGIVAGGVMLLAGQLHWLVGIAAGIIVYGVGVIWGGGLHGDDWLLLARLLESMPMGSKILKLIQPIQREEESKLA